jgi:hypothetical protein
LWFCKLKIGLSCLYGFISNMFSFHERTQLLTQRLLKQGNISPWLKSSLQKNVRSASRTLRNIHFSNGDGPLIFYIDDFLSSTTNKTFYRTWQYEYHDGCLIRNRNCFPIASTWNHPRIFYYGVRFANIMFSFLCFVFIFVCLRSVSCA